jgi:creatinine amidohydrolase
MIAITRELYPELGPAIGHGGEPETSVISYLQPDDVRAVMGDEPRSYADFQGLPMKSVSEMLIDNHVVNLFRDLNELTPSGLNGDPTRGDATRGADLLERTTRVLATFIQQLVALEL